MGLGNAIRDITTDEVILEYVPEQDAAAEVWKHHLARLYRLCFHVVSWWADRPLAAAHVVFLRTRAF